MCVIYEEKKIWNFLQLNEIIFIITFYSFDFLCAALYCSSTLSSWKPACHHCIDNLQGVPTLIAEVRRYCFNFLFTALYCSSTLSSWKPACHHCTDNLGKSPNFDSWSQNILVLVSLLDRRWDLHIWSTTAAAVGAVYCTCYLLRLSQKQITNNKMQLYLCVLWFWLLYHISPRKLFPGMSYRGYLLPRRIWCGLYSHHKKMQHMQRHKPTYI